MRATSARVVSGFARVALETSTTSTSTSAAVAAVSSRALASTSTVSRAHGLDAFVDANRDEKTFVGREWSARELRGKSYEDLHRLWYVLVTERNMLLTEKHLAKTNREPMRAPQRMKKVRKSMARIKHVLTERAIEEAGGDEKKLFEMMRLINAK